MPCSSTYSWPQMISTHNLPHTRLRRSGPKRGAAEAAIQQAGFDARKSPTIGLRVGSTARGDAWEDRVTSNSKQANANSGRERTIRTKAREQTGQEPTKRSAGEANPQQLAMLTQVLNNFCQEHQIQAISDRENAAALIMCLFQRGYQTADNLNDALGMAGTIH